MPHERKKLGYLDTWILHTHRLNVRKGRPHRPMLLLARRQLASGAGAAELCSNVCKLVNAPPPPCLCGNRIYVYLRPTPTLSELTPTDRQRQTSITPNLNIQPYFVLLVSLIFTFAFDFQRIRYFFDLLLGRQLRLRHRSSASQHQFKPLSNANSQSEGPQSLTVLFFWSQTCWAATSLSFSSN